MLSDDLRDLRATLGRNAEKFGGQMFLEARQATALLRSLDHMVAAIRAQEQLIYASARPLPPGVSDIDAERRRREVPAVVQGGAA